MVIELEQMKRINHCVTAFFANLLQGKAEYRTYCSEASVWQFDDLAWGGHEGE